jgi:hypothetical protein
MFGQERSREYAALAAEPDCASDSSWADPRLSSALTEFQGRTTTAKRWPLRMWYEMHQKWALTGF